MLFLESHGRGHARRRKRRAVRWGKAAGILLAVTTVFLVTHERPAVHGDADPGAESAAYSLALPDSATGAQRDNVATAQSAPDRSGQPRLPFEPPVPGREPAREQARADDARDDWTHVTVAPGDNLSLIFSRLKLSKSELHTIVQLDGKAGRLKRLRPGQLIRFRVVDSHLDGLVVELDELNSLWVERSGDSFAIRTETVEPEIRVASASTDIRHSLFLDGQKAGLSDAVIMRLTEIFGWDIDFALDIRADDRFSVIYEEVYKDGALIKQDRILAAEFVNRGKTLRAVLFTNERGESDYYSDEGHAMRKAFLRTPVNFTRISSHFNLRRKHPILNTIRAHRGVDYAAPMGTPVRATANGKIRSVGISGGYGKTVEMQHGKSYRTLYAHLSRFAKGLRRGASVRQGQIIGYVGKSGLATGPHLHYEFRINGVHRNPLTVDLPKAEPIDGKYLMAFREQAAPLLDQLDRVAARHENPDTNIVAQLDSGVPARARIDTSH